MLWSGWQCGMTGLGSWRSRVGEGEGEGEEERFVVFRFSSSRHLFSDSLPGY